MKGGDYGGPFIDEDRKFNLHQNSEERPGLTWAEYAARTAAPVMGLEPHSAPMEMLFYRGTQFHRATVIKPFALHGSWNRARPVGYKIMMITFSNGQPTGTKDFLSGFLVEDGRAQFGRPCGMAVARMALCCSAMTAAG